MNNEKFEIDSNGAPSINVSGTTRLIDINTNGAGKIDTHNLRASRGVVESNGVSRVDLHVADQLDVTVSGPFISLLPGRSGGEQDSEWTRQGGKKK